jgi:hypothetical protein
MADLIPVAGTKIYIGGVMATQAADFVASDFAAQVFTEIDGWELMGRVGDAAQVITKSLINRNRDLKSKGTANAGSMENRFVEMENDAGQIALLAASEPTNKNNYAFKLLYPNGSQRLFVAMATTGQNEGGEANSIHGLSATLEINSNIVKVAA